MKLRYLKTTKTFKEIEPRKSLPKLLQWLRILSFFRDKEITYIRMTHKLQSLENGKWIDVPTIEINEV